MSLNSALNFIQKSQLKNGGFMSYSSTQKNVFTKDNSRQTTFFPSLILGALCEVSHPCADAIKNNITKFLINQKSQHWSYNYWDRTHADFTSEPYPDDLDDTFCALAALYKFNPKLITGEALASIAHMLIETEKTEGGPYRTWLVTNDAKNSTWHDYDLVVNANIGYFLSLQNIELPNVVDFIEKAIKSDSITSPYYSDPYTIIYFISRWYRGAQVPALIKILTSGLKDIDQRTPMQTALVISALVRLGYSKTKLKPAITHLQKAQQTNGSWPPGQLCIDPAKDGKTHYAGSASLTTALCLEALALYWNYQPKAVLIAKNPQLGKNYIAAKNQISQVIDRVTAPELKAGLSTIFSRIKKLDRDGQVALLPWVIAKAIDKKVELNVCYQLSAISLWGWVAYTTYDDFLDGEADRTMLPAANFCLRYLSNALAATLPPNTDFQSNALHIMDRLDAANAWELAHCRATVTAGQLYIEKLPDYNDHWQLADRSLGHTISGLGVLYAAGFEHDSPTVQALTKFFKHYLIARQLNDDAHDWEEDLAAGHINAVANRALRRCYTATKPITINLEQELTTLRSVMWEDCMPDVCNLINAHIASARVALTQPDTKLDSQVLNTLLAPVENAARKTITKRAEALEFIANL